MAYNIKFLKGLAANLPETRDANTLYFVTDTGCIYLGSTKIADKNDPVINLIGTIPEKVGSTSTATVAAYIDAKVAAASSSASDDVDAIESALGASTAEELSTLKSTIESSIGTVSSADFAAIVTAIAAFAKSTDDKVATLNDTTIPAIQQSITDAKSQAVVTVEKNESADAGYAATYVVKQNGVQVGTKINIPKDYLVKSGSVKTCTTANNPTSGLAVGDKYIDFVVNTVDASGTDSHIYINVKDLVDVYSSGSVASDSIVVTIDSSNKITAAITDGTISREKIDASFEAQIAALESAIGTGGEVGQQIDDKIAALDSTKSQTASTSNGQLALSITQTDGKITEISGSIAAETYDAYGAASTAESNAKSYTDTALDTAKGYSDTNLATAKGYTDTALATAESYTDTALTWQSF